MLPLFTHVYRISRTAVCLRYNALYTLPFAASPAFGCYLVVVPTLLFGWIAFCGGWITTFTRLPRSTPIYPRLSAGLTTVHARLDYLFDSHVYVVPRTSFTSPVVHLDDFSHLFHALTYHHVLPPRCLPDFTTSLYTRPPPHRTFTIPLPGLPHSALRLGWNSTDPTHTFSHGAAFLLRIWITITLGVPVLPFTHIPARCYLFGILRSCIARLP